MAPKITIGVHAAMPASQLAELPMLRNSVVMT
jgi:hypothetical protein